MFVRQSVIRFKKSPDMSFEDLELALIDFELEKLEKEESEDGEILVAYGDYKNFGTLNNGIESLNLEVIKASLERIPTNPITLSEEQMIEVEKLLDKIEDDDDVQAIYTNIE